MMLFPRSIIISREELVKIRILHAETVTYYTTDLTGSVVRERIDDTIEDYKE